MSDCFGMPGIGGSLGCCAICGDPFLTEIVLGRKVPSFTIDGCNQTLYAHRKCLEPLAEKTIDYSELPESSPLRQAYEQAKKRDAKE